MTAALSIPLASVTKCLVPECSASVKSRGLCRIHYQRAWNLVQNRVTDWRTLEAQGWAIPRQSRKKITQPGQGARLITGTRSDVLPASGPPRSLNVAGPHTASSDGAAGARGVARRDGPARLSILRLWPMVGDSIDDVEARFRQAEIDAEAQGLRLWLEGFPDRLPPQGGSHDPKRDERRRIERGKRRRAGAGLMDEGEDE